MINLRDVSPAARKDWTVQAIWDILSFWFQFIILT